MFQTILFFSALFACLIWLYLIVMNGWFWLADQRLDQKNSRTITKWPEVVAIIPARNEAETIKTVVESHMQTAYQGRFTLIVVDDQSGDGTGDIVKHQAQNARHPLHLVAGKALPAGWSGKLWAVHNALEAAETIAPAATHILLSDADIRHAPETLTKLVTKAVSDECALVSVMAVLDARGFWGHLLVPAFIFFFQKLYPFRLVNDPGRARAGAAGGCMLIERKALAAIGGVRSIQASLIDDCALARKIKDRGGAARAIWLGFDKGVVSLRDNRALATIWKMVARTAFTQLHFSVFALVGAVLGMIFTYLAAPIAVLTYPLHGSLVVLLLGGVGWFLALMAYWPTVRLYAQSPLWSLLLPLSAGFYMAMTIASAFNHWQGRGGAWKGRTYS